MTTVSPPAQFEQSLRDAPTPVAPWSVEVRRALSEHRLVFALVAAEMLGAALLDWSGRADTLRDGLPGRARFVLARSATLTFYSLPLLLAWERWQVRDVAGKEGWRLAWRQFVAGRGNPRVLLGVVLAVLLTASVAVLHDGFKNLLTLGRYHSWDVQFAAWDRTLHGGRYPHEYLAAIWTRPWLLSLATAPYVFWFPVLAGVNVWQAWSSDRPRRAQYFTCYVLTWLVLGAMAAHAFASMGPVFYGHLVGSTPYGPLEQALDAAGGAPAWARATQAAMWEAWVQRDPRPWLAISAMPSLHVAMAALYTFTVWERFQRVRWVFLAFLLLTLLSSVLLGWHYAIDGYAAVLGVWVLWRLSGALVRTGSRRRPEPGSGHSSAGG